MNYVDKNAKEIHSPKDVEQFWIAVPNYFTVKDCLTTFTGKIIIKLSARKFWYSVFLKFGCYQNFLPEMLIIISPVNRTN